MGISRLGWATGRELRYGVDRGFVSAENVPVGCGGVRVFPGDIIVADGDGVIVVPRGHAEIVARIARDIANDDKASRRQRFREAGLDDDFTVAPLG